MCLHEVVEHALDLLEVGHVAARAKDGVGPDRVEADDVLEPGERAVRGCGDKWPSRERVAMGEGSDRGGGGGLSLPRLSAARSTPVENLSPSTDVPVTIGCLRAPVKVG